MNTCEGMWGNSNCSSDILRCDFTTVYQSKLRLAVGSFDKMDAADAIAIVVGVGMLVVIGLATTGYILRRRNGAA